MESIYHDELLFCKESKIMNNTDIDDDLINNNELQNNDDTEIEDTSPDNNISYSTYSIICKSLYNDIKNDNKISNYVIGLLLETREVVNNTKNTHIVISRLLQKTDKHKKIFIKIKESTNIMLNEPLIIHYKQSFKRKKSVLQQQKLKKILTINLKRKII